MSSCQFVARLFLLLGLFFSSAVYGAIWRVELGTGFTENVRTPLTITQRGHPAIKLWAHYRTYPFKAPPYYDYRIGRWTGNRAIEAEFIHHKIFLINKPCQVQEFSISHGYNMIFVNQAVYVPRYDFIFRLGLGPVIAHPENKVRMAQINSEAHGLFNGGYYLRGITSQLAFEKDFTIQAFPCLFVRLEAKVTAANVRVRVMNGHANVPNVAFHFQLGLGYQSGRLADSRVP